MLSDRRVYSLFWISALVLISAFLSGCGYTPVRTASGGTAGNPRGRVAGNPGRRNDPALSSARAAYWKKRGYDFDPRELSVAGMDMIAANWSPKGWLEFRARYYRLQAARGVAAGRRKSGSGATRSVGEAAWLRVEEAPLPEADPPKPKPLPTP